MVLHAYAVPLDSTAAGSSRTTTKPQPVVTAGIAFDF